MEERSTCLTSISLLPVSKINWFLRSSRALATEIENKEEYEFLKGNKELEAIFSQYLK